MPELNDTADIAEQISQARKLFNSMNRQVLSKANAWRMVVSNTTTNRETAADHTPCQHNHSQQAWF
jgi:hypothetical protein